MTERIINAFVYARKVQPGCEHRLYCKCDVPYWLRESTLPELVRESQIWPEIKTHDDSAQHLPERNIQGSAVSDLQGSGECSGTPHK